MTRNVDLRQLVIERGSPAGPATRRPRHLVSRYLLPAAVVLGFLLVIGWAARESLLPSTPVTVAPVIVSRAEVQQEGTPLFQSAGWIEPRPLPTLVASLAEGVVEKLLVVEGQDLQAQQPVAQLIATDARMALDRTEADQALKEAELAGAKAELAAAETRMKQPVHLQAALSEADSLLAQAEADLGKLPFEVRAAEARVKLAEQDLAGKKAAGAAVAGRLVQKAQGELDSARSQLAELQVRQPRLQRVVATLKERRTALAKQLDLKVEESRQLAAGAAKVQAAEAQTRQARLAVDAAKLHLERMVVRAPVAGRVLKIVTSPGSRLTGLSAISAQDSSTVMSLYDPKMLQVRVDVRLEDVRQVQPGQPVQIETASAPGPIEGEVLYATSVANIQKNTLEVKVAIKNPPAAIRPEMLVQATFLAPPTSGKAEASGPRERLLIPRSLVEKGEGGTAVWVADARNVARRQDVKLGRAGTPELVEVAEGLQATDKLISSGREGLRDGQRIRIAGEDATLGVGEKMEMQKGTADQRR